MDGAEAKAYYGLAVNYRPLEALIERLLVKETLTGGEVGRRPRTPRALQCLCAIAVQHIWCISCGLKQAAAVIALLRALSHQNLVCARRDRARFASLWQAEQRRQRFQHCKVPPQQRHCRRPSARACARQVREVVEAAGLQPFPDAYVEGFAFDEEGQLTYPGMQVAVRARPPRPALRRPGPAPGLCFAPLAALQKGAQPPVRWARGARSSQLSRGLSSAAWCRGAPVTAGPCAAWRASA